MGDILAYLPPSKRTELTEERLALVRVIAEQNARIKALEAENARLRRGAGCANGHDFESNPGMYDTSHRYCTRCGRAEGC